MLLRLERKRKMLTKAPEVGKMLEISTWQVYQLAAEKKLPGIVRLAPRTIRFNREAIERWIAEGCPPVEGEKQVEAAHG